MVQRVLLEIRVTLVHKDQRALKVLKDKKDEWV
jgi:hypothetical protein